MKVICNKNIGFDLSKDYISVGFTQESQFHLVVGREYVVHAMSVWNLVLLILIQDENQLPCWTPTDILTISDDSVPSGWHCRWLQDNKSILKAIWGYENLVTDMKHYDGLLELAPNALTIFRKIASPEPDIEQQA